jgi:hypothetical protein
MPDKPKSPAQMRKQITLHKVKGSSNRNILGQLGMDREKNLRLKRDVNFTDTEKLAKRLIAEHPAKLQVPNSLSYSGGFGMEGAVLQLLATWFRNSEHHVLHTAIQEIKNDSFEDLCNSLFGLCALRLSDSILLADKSEVNLPLALTPAIPIFRNIRDENFKGAFKGAYLTLPAIKSPVVRGGKDREFDGPLYNNKKVVGAQKFTKITKLALAAILPKAADIRPAIMSNLSEIIRELFTNTHRHGRTDVYGNPLSKNFRGIIFNQINMTGSRLDEISQSDGRDLSLFIVDWHPSGRQKKIFRALDITIVDSGPGYARRWHKIDKDQLTIEQEKEAVVSCFSKHNSTDTTDSAGSGLSNVLNDLRELQGWFRLRTGRTLIEKSFFRKGGSSDIRASDIKGMDVFVEGVVFNIVIPLESLFGAQ